MYSNKSIKKKDGKVINSYHYYYCKNQTGVTGTPCTYSKQINEQQLNEEIIQIISKLVADPEFAKKLKDQIKVSTDISTVEEELAALEKKQRNCLAAKKRIENEIDRLDYGDCHYESKLDSLEERLRTKEDEMYAIMDEIEGCIAKKELAEKKAISAENIYDALVNFEKIFPVLDERDQRDLMVTFVRDIFILPEPSETGRRIKSIVFNFPVIGEDTQISLDTLQPVETVVLMSRPLTEHEKYGEYFMNRSVSDIMSEYSEQHDEWH